MCVLTCLLRDSCGEPQVFVGWLVGRKSRRIFIFVSIQYSFRALYVGHASHDPADETNETNETTGSVLRQLETASPRSLGLLDALLPVSQLPVAWCVKHPQPFFVINLVRVHVYVLHE